LNAAKTCGDDNEAESGDFGSCVGIFSRGEDSSDAVNVGSDADGAVVSLRAVGRDVAGLDEGVPVLTGKMKCIDLGTDASD
jgi:hypothetical protein